MATLEIVFTLGGWPFVYREPTERDFNRFIGNGYICPPLVRENDPEVYKYARGSLPPRYPVPSKIGEVVYFDYPDALEIIIEDCDERADPRLCFAVMKPDRFVITDQPNTSPNYR